MQLARRHGRRHAAVHGQLLAAIAVAAAAVAERARRRATDRPITELVALDVPRDRAALGRLPPILEQRRQRRVRLELHRELRDSPRVQECGRLGAAPRTVAEQPLPMQRRRPIARTPMPPLLLLEISKEPVEPPDSSSSTAHQPARRHRRNAWACAWLGPAEEQQTPPPLSSEQRADADHLANRDEQAATFAVLQMRKTEAANTALAARQAALQQIRARHIEAAAAATAKAAAAAAAADAAADAERSEHTERLRRSPAGRAADALAVAIGRRAAEAAALQKWDEHALRLRASEAARWGRSAHCAPPSSRLGRELAAASNADHRAAVAAVAAAAAAAAALPHTTATVAAAEAAADAERNERENRIRRSPAGQAAEALAIAISRRATEAAERARSERIAAHLAVATAHATNNATTPTTAATATATKHRPDSQPCNKTASRRETRKALRLRGAVGNLADGDELEANVRHLLGEAGDDGDDDDDDRGGEGTINRVLIAPVDTGPPTRASGWTARMSADELHQKLHWQGDADVLHRQASACQDLTVVVVNPTGRTNPYLPSRKGNEGCRLPEHVTLVQSGLVDMVILPEAQLDEAGARNVREYIKEIEGVEAKTAPTSAAVCTMEHAISTTRPSTRQRTVASSS